MKLIRFGTLGTEKPGIIDSQGSRRDLSRLFADFDRAFFQQDGLARLSEALTGGLEQFPLVPDFTRWGAPVARPGKIICIGLNYSDHAAESGMAIPTEPIIFMKGANTAVGPYDDIRIPRRGEKTDWEVELGVIIGRDASYLEAPEQSAHHIAGYCISHDVSERAFQLERGGQWTKGKSCDTFNPLGPFLATPDEVQNPHSLGMHLDVNGTRRQTGCTSRMIFDIPFLIHYLSQFMTLEAGDLISTGTPPGVGLGLKPPQFLRAGDVVELAIEGLGSQKQLCVNA